VQRARTGSCEEEKQGKEQFAELGLEEKKKVPTFKKGATLLKFRTENQTVRRKGRRERDKRIS